MSQDHKPVDMRLTFGGIPCYINPLVDKPGICPMPGDRSAFVFKDQAQLDRFKALLNEQNAKADQRELEKMLEASKAAADLADVRQQLGAVRLRKSYHPQEVAAWLQSSDVDRVETVCKSDMHFLAVLGTELEVRQLERDESRLWAMAHGVYQVLTCAYCGHAYTKGTAASGVAILTDHLKVCEKHPMRELEAKLVELKALLETSAKQEFVQGFAAAIATLIRAHDQPSVAVDIAMSNGLQLKDFEACGAEDFDLDRIRDAWRSERRAEYDVLHPTGHCTCAGEGTCGWCDRRAEGGSDVG